MASSLHPETVIQPDYREAVIFVRPNDPRLGRKPTTKELDSAVWFWAYMTQDNARLFVVVNPNASDERLSAIRAKRFAHTDALASDFIAARDYARTQARRIN